MSKICTCRERVAGRGSPPFQAPWTLCPSAQSGTWAALHLSCGCLTSLPGSEQEPNAGLGSTASEQGLRGLRRDLAKHYPGQVLPCAQGPGKEAQVQEPAPGIRCTVGYRCHSAGHPPPPSALSGQRVKKITVYVYGLCMGTVSASQHL